MVNCMTKIAEVEIYSKLKYWLHRLIKKSLKINRSSIL